jgi:cation/acetate symporter
MTDQLWAYIFVGGTFALYIGIAVWARAKSTADFYVAGHDVHPVLNGMATAADWMSAASFISMAGIIAFAGYDGSVYLMGWTGGYVLLALLLAPYLRRFNKFTVPDFVGDRYYSDTARIVAVICALFVSFTYIVGQMKGVGVAFSGFLGVDYKLGVAIGGMIVLFYAMLGGMKGITYTQIAQYCVLIFAYMVPAIFISLIVTGNAVPQLGFLGDFQATGEPMLAKLNMVVTDLGFTAYTDGTKSKLDVFAITAALMIGTAGLPHVIIRFFTVPKASDARLSAGWALVFIALLYTTAPAVAAFARLNFVDTVHESVYAPDETPLQAGQTATPDWFFEWEETGLLAFNDKNGDGRIQYAPGGYEDAASANEVKVDRDIMVLANPSIAGLPSWVIGLVVAGGLAAALSTAAGLLLVISSAISHDLGRRTLFKEISDSDELKLARLASVGAVIIAILAGMYPPDFAAAVVAFAFGLAAASFFPAILLGIFWKRMNREGAIAGMIVGLGFTVVYIAGFKVFGWTNGPEHWLFGISPEGIGTVGMMLNFVVSVTVCLLTPPPPSHVQEIVERIRAPR